MNTFKSGRIFLGPLSKGNDLLNELIKIVEDENINTGVFQVIGAVSTAVFGSRFSDCPGLLHDKYRFIRIKKNLEIIQCTGNISREGDGPSVHAHIMLADRTGKTMGGHLGEGTIIFAAEAFIQELEGKPLVRTYDVGMDLSLW